MSEKPFQEPNIGLNKIYAKTGDTGETRLVGGQTVSKDDLRLECYGTVDELFNLESILATKPEGVGPKQPRVTDAEGSLPVRSVASAAPELGRAEGACSVLVNETG